MGLNEVNNTDLSHLFSFIDVLLNLHRDLDIPELV